ncbi:DNA-binding protein [Rhodomicrobium udaipurense JA643]|uniref:Prolyl-tRNA synthetase associated domain-containing protein n=1 Tax=Rhodomicrobium udaipurense TaxID=1202716 RepID=A0A8I1KIU3_9HYPH|nr:prolyl-tRNA synthetase associated domain-containing protein [Rhodomicrobium udaipurense]KAI95578.1 DNA-binding protein [Rhodomicrobium udaipurense JA643]MBJ7542109.1 prolyl-tRNA synthetase associated domain-containing protein [Rhodomicrobium udaipurense]
MNDWRAFFGLLASLGIAYETVEHEEVHTAQGLASRDVSLWEFPVKNIVVEDKAKQLYLVTMHLLTPPLDLKALAKQLGADGRFSFASPETMGAALKVLPGSVTPFALVNDTERRVRPIFDERMRVSKTVSAHPLVNTMTTTIAMVDLMRLLGVNGHEPNWCALPLKAQPVS